MLILVTLLLQLAADPVSASIGGRDLMTGAALNAPRAGTKGTVLVFLSARCPCSQAHEAALAQLAKDFPDFTVLGVHANQDEPATEAQAHFREAALPFPILEDREAKLADRFGALKTPHAYVLSPKDEVVFQGGVDDSHVAATAQRSYLREALAAIREDRKPPLARARTLGCIIRR
jgi:peroxiredoxin